MRRVLAIRVRLQILIIAAVMAIIAVAAQAEAPKVLSQTSCNEKLTFAQQIFEDELKDRHRIRFKEIRQQMSDHRIRAGDEKSFAEGTLERIETKGSAFDVISLDDLKRVPEEDFFMNLPWYAAYDPALTLLPARLEQVKNPDNFLDLLKWAPLWQRSPQRSRIVKILGEWFMRDGQAIEESFQAYTDSFANLLGWLKANARPDEVALLDRAALRFIERLIKNDRKSFTKNALYLLPLLPFEQLPASFRRELTTEWVNLEADPPLRMDSIRAFHEGSHHTGACGDMIKGHVCTVLSEANSTRHTFNPVDLRTLTVSVQGKRIGVIKRTGDPSMLALRNVMDGQGRLILVAGGTYRLRRDFVIGLLDSGAGQIDLAELEVKPNALLLYMEFGNQTFGYIWNEFLREEMRLMNGDDPVLNQYLSRSSLHSLTRELRLSIWQTLLSRIRAIANRR